jgi:glutamate-1-semialdehyde 2,1-aminomutase
MTDQATDIDPARIEELIAAEEAAFVEQNPRSSELLKRASQALAGGVSCSWHSLTPHPLYGDRGQGSRLWDVDGNERVDMHLGYGAMAAGHAHPKVVEAVRSRMGLGTHFALPVEDTVVVAESLQDRFALALWRFVNSGSEATSDAARIARAGTGRDLIVRVEGCYHGSPDSLDFSYWPDLENPDARDRWVAQPHTAGIPVAFGDLLRIVPYNDVRAVERVFDDEGDRIAAMILEPVMLNVSAILPEAGYLARLREVTRRHGAMLIFDEVKTGATIAFGGAVEWSGVTPDLVTLAKAIGGGVPVGAVGGSEQAMAVVVDGTMEHEGTFNGNPLSMAAARATLTEVLTRDAYDHFDRLSAVLVGGLERSIGGHGLPWHVNMIRSRGGLQHVPRPVRNFREYVEQSDRLIHLRWLYQVNRGLFEPGSDPWTISVQHTEDDVRRYVENFDAFADAVTA